MGTPIYQAKEEKYPLVGTTFLSGKFMQVQSYLWEGIVRSLVLMCPIYHKELVVGCSNVATDYNNTQQSAW